jgi:flagellar basal body rod protein FlgG
MGDGIYVALSGALSQQTALDTTAENLANASTAGYQRMRPVFHEALKRAMGGKLRYETASATVVDTQCGTFRQTGRPLDVALPQGVYLALQTAQGERYTRAGALGLSSSGELRTAGGETVLGENQKPITVDPTKGGVTIAPDGSVTQEGASVGRLRLVKFEKPELLAHEAGTRMVATPRAGAPTAASDPIEVGAVEESNTSVVSGMTELITASRTFASFEKAIDAFREADRTIVTRVPTSIT